MKTAILISMLAVASAALAISDDQRIRREILDPDRVIEVPVGQRHATVLSFPGVVRGVIGYGLTDGKSPGTYQFEAPGGGNVVTLRNLMPDKDCYASVLMDQDLYVFHLQPSENPVIALHLAKDDPSLKPMPEIGVAEVAAQRLDYSDTKLVQLLRKARDRPVWEKSQPQWYESAEFRKVNLRTDQGGLEPRIEEVHRFPEDDAIVLLGRVENKTAGPLEVVPLEIHVRVGERVLPCQLVDFSGVVPGGSSTPFALVLMGDSEGSRLGLSIENDFRVILGESKPYRGDRAESQVKGGSK